MMATFLRGGTKVGTTGDTERYLLAPADRGQAHRARLGSGGAGDGRDRLTVPGRPLPIP